MEMKNHPYLPRDLKLPDFVPRFHSQSTGLSIFLSATFATVALVWILSGRLTKTSKVDRLSMCWWVFTGLIHMIVVGYFVFSPEFYKDRTGFYLAEVWKEFSRGDSRYAGRDAAVVAVEGTMVVFAGPSSLLAMYAIATKKPYSYPLQLIISLTHLYATAVIFITSFLKGDNFSASSFYYYAYYIGGNSMWVVIPTLISIHCWKKISTTSFQLENKQL